MAHTTANQDVRRRLTGDSAATSRNPLDAVELLTMTVGSRLVRLAVSGPGSAPEPWPQWFLAVELRQAGLLCGVIGGWIGPLVVGWLGGIGFPTLGRGR